MFKISLVKVDNPSCLWARVIQGPIGDAEGREQYNKLLVQMNLFYHDATQDREKLRPKSLQDGQVCVVYWAGMKSWCRAVVESVITNVIPLHAHCLLVDHGERIMVPSCQIRVAMAHFLQLPFWVRKFHLAGIRPTTLKVAVFGEMAELVPSSQWDSSATLYLHNLLQASSQRDAVLLEAVSDSTPIELYLSVRDIKICVNDELVAKKFAYYSRDTTGSNGLDAADRIPVMLSSNILTQIISNKAQAQEPSGKNTTTDSVSQPFEPVTDEGDGRSEVTEEQKSPNSQCGNGSEPAAAEGDSSEDTDSSLAEGLNKHLSEFSFLKFLNPENTHQQTPPDVAENDEPNGCLAEEMTVIDTNQDLHAASTAPETDSDESVNECGAAAGEPMRKSAEHWACLRLLEWLNPEPLNPDPDKTDNTVSPTDPKMSRVFVHSALPVEPCNSLEDAPLTDSLRWELQRKQHHTLSAAERHSWPAVARGLNTIIVSHDCDQRLSYLFPLLTHILLNSMFSSLSSSSGPIAVVLCPGWERVQVVYDMLMESRVSRTLHPVSLLLGIAKDEAKHVKIPQNCLLLLTTPFSLVRLLSCHLFLFLRLYHLVLDEADQLFTLAPDQMATILQHFQKISSSKDKASCPQQLVAAAKRWTHHMEDLIASHMPYPCIVITVPVEAALYGNVQQVISMTLENSKISGMLGMLDFSPDVCQKTVIVANSVQEVEDVFKAVSNKSAFTLKTHEGLTHLFDFAIQQWGKTIGRGMNVILVTTNECLKYLGIRDANCVVHYGFPTSPRLFGTRLFCMAENYRNLSERDQSQSCSGVSRSVLLISEKNSRHLVGVLRYLKRTSALLPPELLSFAEGVTAACEDQKTNRPLCTYMKSFGFCRENGSCPDRHRFNSQLDQSRLPESGVIEVIPLHIKTASFFYGRLIRKENRSFDSMASEMALFYSDKKPGAKELLEGGLYAVEEDNVFHRVKILSLPDNNGSLFFSVLVRFIDVGKEVEVKSHQILQLPDGFHSLPGQTTEFIICRVKPVDGEADWHPKVTRAIRQKIQGLQHQARAVLSLHNTIFVDPMIRVTQVPGTKTVINEYNVQTEILNTGMGVRNPEHLDLLKDLCRDGLVSRDDGQTSTLDDGLLSSEVGMKPEEALLAEAFRTVAAVNPPLVQPCEPLPSAVSTNQSQVQDPAPQVHLVCEQEPQLDIKPNTTSAERMESIKDEGELYSTGVPATCQSLCQNGVLEGEDETIIRQLVSSNETKSFHPQVQWYQTSGSVVVTVKLMNPESQRCDFYPDRIIYSGRIGGRCYRADLELHQSIAADLSCWEMKANEPVLKLVKEQPGNWDRLVKNKNIFVSYNMEHFEEDDDDDDKPPDGPYFEGNTGHCWSTDSESSCSSDSD
ncbi:putative ATP-dependent RNA helicase TDRD12 [Cololabis saira]|uniref:putative ATP-dependent RNA helicase TDRD12 n=1 Tax=Cololabis saira TaxID=129043 RepID=UPI002AD3EFA4|nr:putative ATP-dependent RNA helicase TDRD12 [Cololabis saira]